MKREKGKGKRNREKEEKGRGTRGEAALGRSYRKG